MFDCALLPASLSSLDSSIITTTIISIHDCSMRLKLVLVGGCRLQFTWMNQKFSGYVCECTFHVYNSQARLEWHATLMDELSVSLSHIRSSAHWAAERDAQLTHALVSWDMRRNSINPLRCQLLKRFFYSRKYTSLDERFNAARRA